MDKPLHQDLKPGKSKKVDGKIYTKCTSCFKVVQENKFLIGSLHVCEEGLAPITLSGHICIKCGQITQSLDTRYNQKCECGEEF